MGGQRGQREERVGDPGGTLARSVLLGNMGLVPSVLEGGDICKAIQRIAKGHLDSMCCLFHVLIFHPKPGVRFGSIIYFVFQGQPCLGVAFRLSHEIHHLASMPHTQ